MDSLARVVAPPPSPTPSQPSNIQGSFDGRPGWAQSPIGTWEVHCHPEGMTYFYCKQRNIITYIDPSVHQNAIIIEAAYHILSPVSARGFSLDYEIVIDIQHEDGTLRCLPYVADWERHVVSPRFSIPVETLENPNCKWGETYWGSSSGERIHEFWDHVERFPCHRLLPQQCKGELLKMINWALLDQITSTSSRSLLGSLPLESLRPIVESLDSRRPESNYCIGRLMSIFHRAIRSNREGRSREKRYIPRPFVDAIFPASSVLLFGMPKRYWKTMQDIPIDLTVDHSAWDRFVKMARDDWENSKLPSTVLLTTNIGFLAIPNIIESPLATVSSVVSMALCVGSFVTAHTLLRDFHERGATDTESIILFLRRTELGRMGLRILPIRFSLPNGLLIWSMIIFMVATSSLFYEQSSKKTRIVTGVILLSITILVLVVVNLDHPGLNSESLPKSEFSTHVKRRELPPHKWEFEALPSQSPLRDITPLAPRSLSSSIPRTPERIFTLLPRREHVPPHVTRLDRSIVPIPSIPWDERSRSRV